MSKTNRGGAKLVRLVPAFLILFLFFCLVVAACHNDFLDDLSRKHEPQSETETAVSIEDNERDAIYHISTAEDWEKIALHNGDSFIIENDLTLTNPTSVFSDAFSGTLDGAGHVITLQSSRGGLFTSANGAVIRNLTLKIKITVKADVSPAFATPYYPYYFGSVIGDGSSVSITGVNVEGSLTVDLTGAARLFTGGIAGRLDKTSVIENCAFSGFVGGANTAGPIYTGGLAGEVSGMIQDSGAEAGVKSAASTDVSVYTGGLAGHVASGGGVFGSKFASTSDLVVVKYQRGTSSTGGLAGLNEGTLSDSSAASVMLIEGNSSASIANVGGAAGWNNGGTVSNCTVSLNAAVYAARIRESE